jgi:hypothetical protein
VRNGVYFKRNDDLSVARLATIGALAVGLVLSLSAGTAVVLTAAPRASDNSPYVADRAQVVRESNARSSIAASAHSLDMARRVLSSSRGRVAEEATRTSLQTAITTTAALSASSQHSLDVDSLQKAHAPIDLSSDLDSTVALLVSDLAAVRVSEKRMIANRIAAARRAAARHYSVNVWTTGFQAQVNACRGGVDLTAQYGARTIAEHWTCGGRSFPTRPGTVVRITGLDAGTYVVVGVVAVLNAYVATTKQVPRGYSVLFQTCRNNDSHTTEFVALRRS